METYDRHRLERHARRIEELRLWRNAYESPVNGWRFSAGDEVGVATDDLEPNATPTSGKTHEIEPGDFWPEIGIPVNLSARTKVPEEWAGLPVELELWLGGEGFVEISVGESRTASGVDERANPSRSLPTPLPRSSPD